MAGRGHLPAPAILLAVLALTALASTVATRLRLSFPAIGALLGGGQLAALLRTRGGRRAPAGNAATGNQ
ncbi:hypothetical protein NMQ03_03365 [Arthrobacter sp. DNA4]|uniref:hypothetical protein n=1 Tax=Micrococcaceae TaxID=1268 RepID=UPI0020CEA99F|nr:MULTISPECIES: hypothetical protein [Micrococcaceae]UTT70205.1 hypothetical protein NMQ03_03365 [Arthrobacter sp. DNA4]WRT14551.1 hypothetical protein VIK36_03405 [Pseudarthrobacter sp. LT1]